jgi:signal transduction histidine kinase
VYTHPFSTTTPDGRPLHLEISAHPLKNARDEIIACVEVVRDVTEQRKLEMSREEAFSAVSHEMRSPLTAVLGFSQFLLENATSPEQQKEYLGLVVKEGVRLKRLIDNLLSLHRLRAGFGLVNPAPVLLYPLLHEVAEHYRPPVISQRIDIECSREIPAVLGETVRIHEAVTNLLDNAAKYSPAGGRITLGAETGQDNALLWVRDEGPGIPEDQREKIFERFYRLRGSGRPEGTGLGLALVREIAEAHGGRVWVESSTGKGSTFYLSLPFASASSP